MKGLHEYDRKGVNKNKSGKNFESLELMLTLILPRKLEISHNMEFFCSNNAVSKNPLDPNSYSSLIDSSKG